VSLETRHIANEDSLAGGVEKGGPSGMCVLETPDPSNTVTDSPIHLKSGGLLRATRIEIDTSGSSGLPQSGSSRTSALATLHPARFHIFHART
jgi:hypothetical protein